MEQWLILLTLAVVVIICVAVINNKAIRKELDSKAEKELYIWEAKGGPRSVRIDTLLDLILKELNVNLTSQPELKLTQRKKGKK